MVIERKTESAPAPAAQAVKGNTVIIVLNSVIGLLIIGIVYLSAEYFLQAAQQKKTAERPPVRIIQIDVRNGCGIPGCAAQITDILRRRGFDVVEVKNYSSFDIPQTMIIERIDDHGSAQRVASALGVERRNIVRQFNNDYFVDVTVVVGKDYSTLKPSPINISKEND